MGASVSGETNKPGRLVLKDFLGGIERSAHLLRNGISAVYQLIDMTENELLMSKIGFPGSLFALSSGNPREQRLMSRGLALRGSEKGSKREGAFECSQKLKSWSGVFLAQSTLMYLR